MGMKRSNPKTSIPSLPFGTFVCDSCGAEWCTPRVFCPQCKGAGMKLFMSQKALIANRGTR